MSTGSGQSPAAPTGTAGTAWLAALLLICSGALVPGCSSPLDQTVRSMHLTDYTRLVDNNQGPGEVFMRYPLGRIGLWSTPEGEIADSVTRGLMLYPTVDDVVDKGTASWRASIRASPSRTDITYAADVAARGSTAALTITPDVSVYQYRFRGVTTYAAVDLLMQQVENSNVTWSASTFRYLGRTGGRSYAERWRRPGGLLPHRVQPPGIRTRHVHEPRHGARGGQRHR